MVVLDDSPLRYRENKIGNDFLLEGNGRLHRSAGTHRVAQFYSCAEYKDVNSGTQDDSPVWGTENQIGNEFFGNMVDFVSFLFKSGLCCLILEALQLTQGKIPQSLSD